MKTFAGIVLATALASPAFAQGAQDNPWKDIKIGDRVEITLKSQFAVRGKLVLTRLDEEGRPQVYVDAKVDVAKLKRVLLDINMEYPDLTGEMGIDQVEVKSVRKLKDLTPEEAEAIEKARAEAVVNARKSDDARRRLVAQDEQERQAAIDRAKQKGKDAAALDAAKKLEQQAELIRKAKKIYEKFPPPAWGPHKMKAIADKARLLQQPTPQEREFAAEYELWSQYDQYLKGEAEKEKEKKTPTTETPKETPTETPKEAPKEVPKEDPKEPPKEDPVKKPDKID